MEPSRKRPRGVDRQRIARAISARINSMYPYKDYGRVYHKRGTPEGIALYGDSYKLADEEQRARRKAVGYIGRGLYKGKGLYTGRGGFFQDVLGTVGKIGGGLIGMPDAGEKLGNWVGGKFEGKGLYTGRGLYQANQLMMGNAEARPPMTFAGSGDETSSLIITQTEYIGDVYAPSTANFVNTSYALNPGLAQNFPFLSQFAQNFDEYEFVQLVFEYHSTIDASATNNTAGNTGTVIMATNYNASAAPFDNKESMIQYHGGVSGRMTEKLVHGVECDPKKMSGAEGKYTRTGIPANQDLKTYDLGTFQLAFQNIPTPFFNQQVGELWVSYTVKLRKPKLFSGSAGNVLTYRGVSNGGISLNNIRGTNWCTAIGNSLQMQSYTPGLGGIGFIFPATVNGIFDVTVFIEGVSMTSLTSGWSLFGNITRFEDIYASDNISTLTPGGQLLINDANRAMCKVRVQVKAATGGVNNQLSILFLNAGTPTQCYAEITEYTPFLAQSSTVAAPLFANSLGQVVPIA